MKRVLCVRFLNWPIQRLQRQWRLDNRTVQPLVLHTAAAPEPPGGRRRSSLLETDLKYARTLYPSARSGPAVVAVSDDAWAQGIRPGMPLAEARSMARPLIAGRPLAGRTATAVPEIHFCEWDPLEDRRQLQSVADLTRRFAPVIGLDDMPVPDSLLLDITGCGPLFGSESALAEQLLKQLQTAGCRCRICVADSVAAVWALTHPAGHGLQMLAQASPPPAHRTVYGRPRHRGRTAVAEQLPLLILPPGQQRDYLKPLPLAAGRLPPADIDILQQLGLRTLQQLLNLPREDLPARLSRAAVTRVRQLTDLASETIAALPEAQPVAAAWDSEFPADNHQELLQVFQHLLQPVCEELLRRRIGCLCITCRLYSSPCPARTEQAAELQPVVLQAGLLRPTQSAELLLDMLALRLETLPVTEPVHRVHMQASTAPLPVARQRDLFSATEHLVPQDELATLVNRLSSRLGHQSVVTLQRRSDPRPEHMFGLTPLLTVLDQHGSPSTAAPPPVLQNVLLQLVTPDPSPAALWSVPAQASAAVAEHPVPTEWMRHAPLQPAHRPPLRPVRLLAVPFLLTPSDGAALHRDGFIWQGQRLQIQDIVGPERIQTAWWSDAPVQRDYYRVTTHIGALFWIFRDLATGLWYVHGLFD